MYNGDIWSKAEADRVHRSVNAITSPGCDELSTIEHKVPIMICRPALWNPTIFSQFINKNLIQEDSNPRLSTEDTSRSSLQFSRVI